jgi:predicted Zn-dependent protease
VLDVAKMAVEAATAAGADLADARAGTDETESLTVRNQEMAGIDGSISTGVGIRVLVGGRWGFAPPPGWSRGDHAHGRPRRRIAKAAQRLPASP